MAKLLCKIGGIVLLLVGVVGFFVPSVLGMHLTLVHDVIHLVSGGLAAFSGFKGSLRGAALFCTIFGVVYGLVAVLGFVAPALLGTILGHEGALTSADLMPDNLVHVAVSAAFLVVGLVSLNKS